MCKYYYYIIIYIITKNYNYCSKHVNFYFLVKLARVNTKESNASLLKDQFFVVVIPRNIQQVAK